MKTTSIIIKLTSVTKNSVGQSKRLHATCKLPFIITGVEYVRFVSLEPYGVTGRYIKTDLIDGRYCLSNLSDSGAASLSSSCLMKMI